MDKAKLRLSAKEAELIANADWILTKNEIIQKVKLLLADIQFKQQHILNLDPGSLPMEVTVIPAKISRGENYLGLPWLILDYPRLFGKEEQFAIRTMFWWGHFFSITLHLAGRYKKMYESKIESSFLSFKHDSFFLGIHADQWEHHFETNNYRSLSGMTQDEFSNSIRNMDFIKLAKKIPLDQWNDADDILSDSFAKMIEWIRS